MTVAVWPIYEQTCTAALDCGDFSLAKVCDMYFRLSCQQKTIKPGLFSFLCGEYTQFFLTFKKMQIVSHRLG